LLRELDDHGGKSIEAAKMTFNELADYYEKTYLIEPQYVGDRKVAGLRSYNDCLGSAQPKGPGIRCAGRRASRTYGSMTSAIRMRRASCRSAYRCQRWGVFGATPNRRSPTVM